MVVSKQTIAYAATTLGGVLLNSVFQLYYVKTFFEEYSLTRAWFYAGQSLYMVWNAVNDPLFGWIQDSYDRHGEDNRVVYSRAIMRGGPLLALSFLVPWFPWAADPRTNHTVTGLHFLFTLLFYDCMFTWVMLAQCGLFADLESRNSTRAQLLAASQFATILASAGVFGANAFLLDDVPDFSRFRMFALLLAAIAALCFYITGAVGATFKPKHHTPTRASTAPASARHVDAHLAAFTATDLEVGEGGTGAGSVSRLPDRKASSGGGSPKSLLRVYCQILKGKNFLRFVFINFCQIFDNTVNDNFYAIWMVWLVGDDMSKAGLSSLLGSSVFVVPFLSLFLTWMVHREGSTFRVIHGTFLVKLVMAVSMYALGSSATVALAAFLFGHKALSAATFSMFNMTVAEVIDEDKLRNKRERRLGSSFFGLNALITKPAQSVAPMVVVAVLSQHGYTSQQQHQDGAVDDDTDVAHNTALRETAFVMLCLIPAVAAGLQLLVWRSYSLRGADENGVIKATMSDDEDDSDDEEEEDDDSEDDGSRAPLSSTHFTFIDSRASPKHGTRERGQRA